MEFGGSASAGEPVGREGPQLEQVHVARRRPLNHHDETITFDDIGFGNGRCGGNSRMALKNAFHVGEVNGDTAYFDPAVHSSEEVGGSIGCRSTRSPVRT